MELDALHGMLSGRTNPAAISLAGEAGIGKTRLARWATSSARECGWAVIGGGTHLGLPEPLGVLRDAVRNALREGLAPTGDDRIARGLPEMLLPELGGAASRPAADSGAVFEATIRYLGALGRDRPLLLVLEDLHWADPSSLTFTAMVARALPSGVGLVVTFRPDDKAGAAPLERLRSELSRLRVREVLLLPLHPEECAQMLAELLGRRPQPDVEAELIRLSGGNPFALEELARAVVESGWIDPATGSRQSDESVAVPWTLAESIRVRSSRLDPRVGDVLRWCAVIGEQFDVRLVAAAAEITADAALDALSACVEAGLVVEDPSDRLGNRFTFRHALVHEALVQERLVAERIRRHAAVIRAAERMAAEGLDVPPAELARHAIAAGDRRRIVTYCQAAARQEEEAGAVEDAIGHLELALARWSEEDGHRLGAELLLECGRLRARVSRGDERAVELLEQARNAMLREGDDAAAASALVLLADARFECGERIRALVDWEQALVELRASGQDGAIPQALAAQSRGVALQGDLVAAAEIADEGLRLLTGAGTPDQARVRVSLLTTRGMVDMLKFNVDAGRARLLDAARIAVEHGDDLGAARAHHILGGNFFAVPLGECVHHFGRAAELVRRHGLRGLEGWYLALQGYAMAFGGDWTGAERTLDEAEALVSGGADRAAWTRMLARSARATRLEGLGDLSAARAAHRAAAAIAEEIGSPLHLSNSGAMLAGLDFLAGDIAAAARGLRPASDSPPLRIADLEIDGVLCVVDVLAAIGAAPDAQRVASELRTMFDSSWADYAEAVALVGDLPDADVAEGVRVASDAVDAVGHRYLAARMPVCAGLVLAARPSARIAAVSLLRLGHERFAKLGSPAWCRYLEERLRELGEPLPRRRGGAGGLTRREVEVLATLAEGLTNRGIAERLVISESTAIRHVANIYRKLGASNRAAAVRIATERGIIATAREDT